jgi:type IV pilus assembly protein PilO
LVILLAGWFLVWVEQLESLQAKQRTELKLREEFVAKKKQAVNLDLYVQQPERDRSLLRGTAETVAQQVGSRIFAGRNQPGGDGTGPAVRVVQARRRAVKDFYAELPINVRLTGTYHDFGAFAGDIGKLSRIVTLNNIAIHQPQSKDGTLVMDAITKTFRYLDEEELAAKKKAAQAAEGWKEMRRLGYSAWLYRVLVAPVGRRS